VAALAEATVGSSCFGDVIGIDSDDLNAGFVDEKVELASAGLALLSFDDDRCLEVSPSTTE
jgi:hypothetical protein